MCKITDIDDHRSPEYWRNEVENITPDKRQIVSFAEIEKSSDDRIAYIKIFNLIHELHDKGMSMEDIFCGGLRALMYKSLDLCDERSSISMYKRAHDELTRVDDTPCYHRLNIDDIT